MAKTQHIYLLEDLQIIKASRRKLEGWRYPMPFVAASNVPGSK
jgi:hypothetical protein